MKQKTNIYVLKLFLWFIIFVMGGLLLGQLLSYFITLLVGVGNIEFFLKEFSKGKYPEHTTIIKLMYILIHLSTYTCSTLAFVWFIKQKKIFQYLFLTQKITFLNYILLFIIAITTYPLALWVYFINLQIVPTSWIAQDTLNLQIQLMKMNHYFDLIMNIFLIGIVAGLGEELVFRGVFQRFMTQIIKQKHIAIWITAALFSFIHFQLEGFIPRFLLGALLGYLLLWTGNLWSSIIVHISFNSIQVILFYFMPNLDTEPSATQIADLPILISIFALVLFILACYFLWKRNQSQQLTFNSYNQIE